MASETQKIRLLLELTGPDAKKLIKLTDNKNPIKIKASLEFNKSKGGDFALLKKLKDDGLNIKTTIQFTGPDAKILRELCAGKLSPTIKVKTDVGSKSRLSSSSRGGGRQGAYRPTAQESQKQLNVDTVKKYNKAYESKEYDLQYQKKLEQERRKRFRLAGPVNDDIYKEELADAKRRVAERSRQRILREKLEQRNQNQSNYADSIISKRNASREKIEQQNYKASQGLDKTLEQQNKKKADLREKIEQRNNQQSAYTDKLIAKQNAKARQESYNSAILAGQSQKYKQNFEKTQRKDLENEATTSYKSGQSRKKLTELLDKQKREDFRGSFRKERAETSFRRSSVFEKEDEVLKRISYQEGFVPGELSHLKGQRKVFDKNRLKNQGVGESLALSFLLGGPAEAAGGLVGAGLTGSVAGVTLGAAGAAAAFGVLGFALEKAISSGAEFQRSIVAITAGLQSISTISGPNGEELSTKDQILTQETKARELQFKARGRLLPLGISGGREAAIVSSLVTSLGSKQLSDDTSVGLAEGIGALVQSVAPEIDESRLRRDARDIFLGLPQAGRTTLGAPVQGIVKKFKEAKDETDYKNIVKELQGYSEAIKDSSQGLTQWNNIMGNLQGIFTTLGDTIIQDFQPALKFIAEYFERINKRTQSYIEGNDKAGEDLKAGKINLLQYSLADFASPFQAPFRLAHGAQLLEKQKNKKPKNKSEIRPLKIIETAQEQIDSILEERNDIEKSRLATVPSFNKKERINTELKTKFESINEIDVYVQESIKAFDRAKPEDIDQAKKRLERVTNSLSALFAGIKELIVEGISNDLDNLDAKTTPGFVGDFQRLKTNEQRRILSLTTDNGLSFKDASALAGGERARATIDTQINAFQAFTALRSATEAFTDALTDLAFKLKNLEFRGRDLDIQGKELAIRKNLDLPIEEEELNLRDKERKLQAKELDLRQRELPIKKAGFGIRSDELGLKFKELDLSARELPIKFRELASKATQLALSMSEAAENLKEFDEDSPLRQLRRELEAEKARNQLPGIAKGLAVGGSQEERLTLLVQQAEAYRAINEEFKGPNKEQRERTRAVTELDLLGQQSDSFSIDKDRLSLEPLKQQIEKKKLALEAKQFGIDFKRFGLEEPKLNLEREQLNLDEFKSKSARAKLGIEKDYRIPLQEDQLEQQRIELEEEKKRSGRYARNAAENLALQRVQTFQQFVGTKFGDQLRPDAEKALSLFTDKNKELGLPSAGTPKELLDSIEGAATVQNDAITTIRDDVKRIADDLAGGLDKKVQDQIDAKKKEEADKLKEEEKKQNEIPRPGQNLYKPGEKKNSTPSPTSPSPSNSPWSENPDGTRTWTGGQYNPALGISDILDNASLVRPMGPQPNLQLRTPQMGSESGTVLLQGNVKESQLQSSTNQFSNPFRTLQPSADSTGAYHGKRKSFGGVDKATMQAALKAIGGGLSGRDAHMSLTEMGEAITGSEGFGKQFSRGDRTTPALCPLYHVEGMSGKNGKGGALPPPLDEFNPNNPRFSEDQWKELRNEYVKRYRREVDPNWKDKTKSELIKPWKLEDSNYSELLTSVPETAFLESGGNIPQVDIFETMDKQMGFKSQAKGLSKPTKKFYDPNSYTAQTSTDNVENAAAMAGSLLGEDAKKFKSVETSAGSIDLAQGLFAAVTGSNNKASAGGSKDSKTTVDEASISKLGDVINRAFQTALGSHFGN